MDHINFWWEFAGKVGAPIFAATIVASLTSGNFYLLHGTLVVIGLVMMWLSHLREYHFKSESDKTDHD